MSYLSYLRQNASLIEECYTANQQSDTNRVTLHSAAIAIQKTWRGYILRQKIKHLNKMATTIQSVYRGYKCRKWFHVQIAISVEEMRRSYYDIMATKIQSTWRGYRSRKVCHNFYARKKYLEFVQIQNEIVVEQLTRYKQHTDDEKQRMNAILEEQAIINEARKTHYLLSTSQVKGVYDPRTKNGQRRYPMDEMLRSVRPLGISKINTNAKQQSATSILSTSGSALDKPVLPNIGTSSDLYDNNAHNNYSPTAQMTTQNKLRILKAKKISQPQGPFKRGRMEVLSQRFRPLKPSLRVSESYNVGIEEARQQLKFDDYTRKINKGTEFVPVMVQTQKEKYQQLLHSTSPYGHIDYGNKHFRAYETEIMQGLKETELEPGSASGERFATVVSPIPDFDKYLEKRERVDNTLMMN